MSDRRGRGHTIATIGSADLAELLALMRAYCAFYETDPSEEALIAMSRTLLADPAVEGVQHLARAADGTAVGFASVFWSWDTTEACRIGIMNDLFVAPQARGTGVAEDLIEACLGSCARRGAARLDWQTAEDNLRAQAVYDRVGGVRGSWLLYSKPVPPPPAVGGDG